MISAIQTVPPYRNENFLREHYLEKGLNISEISRLTCSSRAAIRGGLKSFGFPIRGQDELPKNKTQLKYGEALRGRQIVNHQRELETLDRIKRLRNGGFSYWKIAKILNSMRVPTKTRRGKWHARSVLEVLKND